MDMVLSLIVAASIAGLVYIYIGYPLIVWALGRWPRRTPQAGVVPTTVSVVLAVYNESRHIRRKLDSLLAMHRSDQIIEILVGSDGSTDDTPELVIAYGDPRVRLHRCSERRGKPAMLNELIPQARGEIVLLTDARQEFDPAFLQAALANFADPRVGVVSGELVLRTSSTTTTAGEGIGLYWRYEKFLRNAESHFRGVPGATGACYLVRRDLYQPIHPLTILDDVAIPLSIVAQGYRCVFERGALAFDEPAQAAQQEAIRKRRTIAGAAQLIRYYPQWLLPWRNPLWFEFVSHKLARLLSPLLLMAALLGCLPLLPEPLYVWLAMGQLGCYAAAGVGWGFQRLGRRSVLFGPFLMFLTLNLTTVQALWDAARSRYRVTWQRAVM